MALKLENNIIGYRIDTMANLILLNLVFASNDLIYVTTENVLFFGDGEHRPEYITPIVGTMGVNHAFLTSLIADANALILLTEVYTSASIATLTTAITAAGTANALTTQTGVDAGIVALQLKIDGLVKK